ncbi:hypothetical protein H8S61_01780 [Eggerthella sp. NSJ-70]|uniref:Uncharacterized protein n=1 Tax=Eggerthella hominis TaxID=2763043 RepID=A0ABR7BMW1_9ACTN|nr:hypothetical protein [Eggerthella hominis]MBC5582934.1 hypothetical protein [Eggerthella hominis]
MNAEFAAKMLEAKRLEAEALALLVPPEARQAAACAVRACAAAALGMLEGASAPHAPSREERTAQPEPKQRERGLRSIVIE